MAKIVINIDMDELTSGINQVVDDDFSHYFTPVNLVPLSAAPPPRE